MPRVLITGIAGQTGSHLADYILKSHPDWEVHGTVRYRSDLSNIQHIASKLHLHDCELRDAVNVFKVVEKVKPDKVFHLAATSFVRSSWDQPSDIIVNNVTSQINLFEALLKFSPEAKVQVACFPKGTRIQTPFGYKPIENVNVGDYVISHNGEPNIVSDKSCVPHHGNIRKIHIMGCKKFETTNNHPILAFKRSDVKMPSGKKKKNINDPNWIKASDLRSGDYVAIVANNHCGDAYVLHSADYIDKNVLFENRIYPPCQINGVEIRNGNSQGLPAEIELNKQFGYLCGAFLAEGSKSGENKAIRLHIHENEIFEGIGLNCINYLNKLGITPRVYPDKNSKGATIFIGSSLLSQIFIKLLGHGSKTKSIAKEVFSWNKNCLLGLIAGYLDGDGTIPSRDRSAKVYIGSSVNENLIDQLFVIGNKIGLNPSRSGPFDQHKNSLGNSPHWCISFSQNWAPELFENKLIPKQHHEIFHDGQYFRRILSIEDQEYNGNVYNFTVKNDHTYVVEGVCVHNCSSEQFGDVKEDEVPITEDNDLRPISPYAVSKCAQENLAFQYYKSYGLHTLITRTFNHTGPRRGDAFVESSFSKQVAMIEAGLQEPIIKHGNLESVRDYTDARDVAEAYWVAMDKCNPGEPYNICSSMKISIGQLLDLFIGLSTVDGGIRKEVDPDRLRPSDVILLYGNSDKFQAVTGWAPKFGLEQTMSDLLDAWRKKVSVMKALNN